MTRSVALRGWTKAIVVLALLSCPAVAHAQGPAANNAAGIEENFWWLFWFGAGWFGFTIMVLLVVCSLAVLAVAVENILRLRRPMVVPMELADEVYHHVSQGEWNKAEELCRQYPSMLATILTAGLQDAKHGHDTVEKTMEDVARDQNARLHRKLEHLSLLSTTGPMLGLLGTVWGMVVAFQKVAETQGRADPGQLAGGIYQALYTTVFGLLIAIPGLICYGLLRNRVDNLSAECSLLAERAIAPRRGRTRRPSEPGAPRKMIKE